MLQLSQGPLPRRVLLIRHGTLVSIVTALSALLILLGSLSWWAPAQAAAPQNAGCESPPCGNGNGVAETDPGDGACDAPPCGNAYGNADPDNNGNGCDAPPCGNAYGNADPDNNGNAC